MYPLNAKHFGLDQKLTDLLNQFAGQNNLSAEFVVHATVDGTFLHGQFEFRVEAEVKPAPVVPVEPKAPAVPRDGPGTEDDRGPAVISTVQATLIEQMLHNQLGIAANLFDSIKKAELLVTREHGASQVLCLVDGVIANTGGIPLLNVTPVLTIGNDLKYSKANPRYRAHLADISHCWLPATLRGQKPVKGQPVIFRGVARGKDTWLHGQVTSVRDGEVGVAYVGAELVTLVPIVDCWTQVAKHEKPATTAPKAPTKADKRRAMKPGANK